MTISPLVDETSKTQQRPGESLSAVKPGERHFGMDWLRIAAFALLIIYHIAMVFAPWPWVIHTDYSVQALVVPMALLKPWRLPLLFTVSGFASWYLVQKSPSIARFMRARNKRLLIPLAFAMVAFIPPEMWVRLIQSGYPHDLWYFWAKDYWRIGEFWGREFPSWEHLWFVVYLWAYTAVLALTLWRAGSWLTARTSAFAAWLSHGKRLIWVPALLLIIARLGLQFIVPDEKGLLRDWAGHALYLPMFYFGFALAGNPGLWTGIQRHWRLALFVAAIGGAVEVAVDLSYPGPDYPPHWAMVAFRAGQMAMAWSMTLFLLFVADRYFNRDHKWRKTLSEAVFPFFLVHQPAIVLIAKATMPDHLSPVPHFLLILLGTVLVCCVTYWGGRQLKWLRPMIGLGPKPGLQK